MPALKTGTVLVTGGSGFLGSQIVGELLAQGYKARAVVRDDTKGAYIQKTFPGAEYVIVKDMMAPGAYDKAVSGIDGVVHTASPVDVSNAGDPQNVIGPSVAGVRNLLDAVANPANGANVQRFVQISSIAAICGLPDGTHKVLTDDMWNEADMEAVNTLGAKASGPQKYIASKVEGERAFWKFLEGNKAFDGVAILPGMVLGPSKEYYAPGGKIVSTNSWALAYTHPGITADGLKNEFWAMVDVRDVAKATVRALSVPKAGGQRYIIAGHPVWGNDMALVAAKVQPTRGLAAPNTDPAFRKALEDKATLFDGSKAERDLGFTYTPREKTLEELYRWADSRGE